MGIPISEYNGDTNFPWLISFVQLVAAHFSHHGFSLIVIAEMIDLIHTPQSLRVLPHFEESVMSRILP